MMWLLCHSKEIPGITPDKDYPAQDHPTDPGALVYAVHKQQEILWPSPREQGVMKDY